MRALVCLSGGVDSAVAALLLKQRGYDVAAITFWYWSFANAPDYAGTTKCCALDTAALAARELDIPHQELDESDAFHDLVLTDFIQRYQGGQTPNPCGRCNRYLRFGRALQYAQDNGFDVVATGHHVRKMQTSEGAFQLVRGADANKDQTYFLYGLSQQDLGKLEFPVGDLSKAEVVALARQAGLTAAELPESQDLCFALDGDTSFLFPPEAFTAGPILTQDGTQLGTHNGLPHYTIGQRRGLGIAAEQPLYIIAIEPQRNALIVGPDEALLVARLTAAQASYISGSPPKDGTKLGAKIRYRSPAVSATYHRRDKDGFTLIFDEPQRAITPGQLAVLYDGDRLLGGGTIESEPCTVT